jgi:hypothetical protein
MSSAERRAISLQPSRQKRSTLFLRGSFRLRHAISERYQKAFRDERSDNRSNLERLFALTMNATTVEIPSSHVVMLLHPLEVAAVIRKAAAVGGEQP